MIPRLKYYHLTMSGLRRQQKRTLSAAGLPVHMYRVRKANAEQAASVRLGLSTTDCSYDDELALADSGLKMYANEDKSGDDVEVPYTSLVLL